MQRKQVGSVAKLAAQQQVRLKRSLHDVREHENEEVPTCTRQYGTCLIGSCRPDPTVTPAEAAHTSTTELPPQSTCLAALGLWNHEPLYNYSGCPEPSAQAGREQLPSLTPPGTREPCMHCAGAHCWASRRASRSRGISSGTFPESLDTKSPSSVQKKSPAARTQAAAECAVGSARYLCVEQKRGFRTGEIHDHNVGASRPNYGQVNLSWNHFKFKMNAWSHRPREQLPLNPDTRPLQVF